ncbi:MAG: Hsp20/alpha crystallin family protein [Methanomicrobiaceae archaeon]|nr:Hsp20/alpha crystallin family protein [Methanomicrobiaceae archaeon]MDD5418557.1 Hsp20/alpha crystallin family protein [Methanomicrobiaceae archaeon]
MAEVEVYPAIYAMPDEEHENLHIEIELPGVEKENIRLRMHEDSFTISAMREDIRYVGSYAVCCPVDYEQARAEFRNGLLIIDVPYKKPQVRGREIPVA